MWERISKTVKDNGIVYFCRQIGVSSANLQELLDTFFRPRNTLGTRF